MRQYGFEQFPSPWEEGLLAEVSAGRNICWQILLLDFWCRL